jgi:L-fucose isomerase-like protein
LKIFIAAFNEISEKQLSKAKNSFMAKFKTVKPEDFVYENPDVIWFLTGGSEHNALKQIESHNIYSFIASQNENSWAAATEVKAYLNSKGINTRIFDFEKLESLELIDKYLKPEIYEKVIKLGLVGNSADWLVASIPDFELLKEVLNIDVINFSSDDLINTSPESSINLFESSFGSEKFEHKSEIAELYSKIVTFVLKNNLEALSIDCFSLIKKIDFTPCLPFAIINSSQFPIVCEGDLCSAAGMIVCKNLTGQIPWMANLMHMSKDCVEFSHCTIPLSMLDKYNISTHYETGKNASIEGQLTKQMVTVFRIDKNLENCFLALGEVISQGDVELACKTQAKIKMSSKSLFLLREFPLGNHHLIVPGDHTDILAEYFTNKGFKIV